MQRGSDFTQFTVAYGYMPGVIWLFHWLHWGIKWTISGLYDAHPLQLL